MPRINEIQFAQTSSSAFCYRSSKRPYTLNNEDHQISESDILQKLKLILISMREQSFKANKYFEQEMQKLQSQINQQSNIIKLLQEQNKLLRSHVNIYESKFGGLSKIYGKSLENVSSDVKIISESGSVQNKQIIEGKNDLKEQLKIHDDKKENVFSKMSTKYESNIEASQLQKEKDKKQEHHQDTSSKYTDQLSQNGSTCSNFYKKSLPYHHRRQSSLQQQQSKGLYQNHDINILPLVTRCQKAQKTEVSQISQLQSRKNTIIDIFNEESSQQQSEDAYQEINELGLQSKGNGFFSSGLKWTSQNRQQTLLIQNYEPHYENKNSIQLCRYVESREDFEECQDEQETLKENNGMRKMSSIIQRNFNDDNIQSYERTEQVADESEEKSIEHISSQNIGHKSSICGQKRLRALFTPLKQNIMSKKINLPFMTKQEHNKELPLQIEKSSQILGVLADFNKKKSYGFENSNPLQQAIKKLKKSEEMKIKY